MWDILYPFVSLLELLQRLCEFVLSVGSIPPETNTDSFSIDLKQLHARGFLYAVLSPRAEIEVPVRHRIYDVKKGLVEPFSTRTMPPE